MYVEYQKSTWRTFQIICPALPNATVFQIAILRRSCVSQKSQLKQSPSS